MAVSVCQNCGSRRFRADRSMAGRLVCQNCGLAAGSRATRSTSPSSRRSTGKRWLVILLIAVIVLAPMLARAGKMAFRTKRIGAHLLCGLCAYSAILLWLYGAARMPVAEFFALQFITPLFTIALAMVINMMVAGAAGQYLSLALEGVGGGPGGGAGGVSSPGAPVCSAHGSRSGSPTARPVLWGSSATACHGRTSTAAASMTGSP